ncbi:MULTISPECIES: phage tail tube protein [unclassified Paenibacillus]|uniref:phage tail tube protein n=1 Tax=unclassified Paenibacillus TaxID=185978 RepID=UPI000660D17B|nr:MULTISPECIES: phage tail tube protein [unclassified Paenibacillus]ASS64678.1 phage tail tube protein [Paenibacillus sp. RUD330]ASS66552.1 phage tail tube protein [Paenibacillus sp. RUD330]
MPAGFNGERIISGTGGELWIDGDYVAEVKAFQAKLEFNKEDVQLAGNMGVDSKFMGYKGNGSVRLHKVNSRMIKKYSAAIQKGILPRATILSSLNDPAAFGAERVTVSDASFNDLTLADWEAGVKGETEAPFTFTKWETNDLITGGGI